MADADGAGRRRRLVTAVPDEHNLVMETAQQGPPALTSCCLCSGIKQLKWEAERDDWMQGRDVKSLRRRKTGFRKRKMTSGRRRK